MNLIIVESPTKARTFGRYLDAKDYQIEATMGHVRDLPENKIGIAENENFKPNYIISTKKKATVTKNIRLAKKRQENISGKSRCWEGGANITSSVGFLPKYCSCFFTQNGKFYRQLPFF